LTKLVGLLSHSVSVSHHHRLDSSENSELSLGSESHSVSPEYLNENLVSFLFLSHI
jgi:hypothetical protein